MFGPAGDTLNVVDGKKLRHAGGVELVSAFGVESGRWMGGVCTAAKSSEIPAARELLEKIDVAEKTSFTTRVFGEVRMPEVSSPGLPC